MPPGEKNTLKRLFLSNCNLAGKHNVVDRISNILIEGEFIKSIGKEKHVADKYIDCSGYIVIPGMIDPHVHMRDLNQSNKEDWTSGSRAALKGGITTVLDMPNTNPPTTSLRNLKIKLDCASKSFVNYGFFLGVNLSNLADINVILESEYNHLIAGLKVFMGGSTGTSGKDLVSGADDLKKVFVLAEKYSKPVVVHCELQSELELWHEKEFDRKMKNHHLLRHRDCAIKGTDRAVKMALETGVKLYVAHVSTGEELDIIRRGKKKGKIFCEVTPHHLLLNLDSLDLNSNFGKVNPPIREESDCVALWEGISDGTIDAVGSDHAPHIEAEKCREYDYAPSGISGLDTALALLMNEVIKNRITMDRFLDLCSNNAASIFEITNRGQIKPGYFADLVIIDPSEESVFSAGEFESKAKFSPFDGHKLSGQIISVIINGEIGYSKGKFYNIKGKEINCG